MNNISFSPPSTGFIRPSSNPHPESKCKTPEGSSDTIQISKTKNIVLDTETQNYLNSIPKTRWLGSKLFFNPSKEMKPINEKLFQEVYINTPDGEKINGLYMPAAKDKPTVIFCHGKANNITYYQNIAEKLAAKGYGLFLQEYRGFGKSTGRPSEEGCYTDLESTLKYLEQNGIERKNIILWGHSMGGAVVSDIASRSKEPFCKVILHNTFDNIRSVVKNYIKIPILGFILGFILEKFLNIKFKTDEKLATVKSPLLILHSEWDRMAPYSMSQKLARINSAAELVLGKFRGHCNNLGFDKVINDCL